MRWHTLSRCGEQIAWSEQDTAPLTFVHTLEQAAINFTNYNPDGSYADCHAWQFTPSSFRLIMNDLANINLLDLKERAFHSTIACEFFMALSRSAPGCSLDRITLASMAVARGDAAAISTARSRCHARTVMTMCCQRQLKRLKPKLGGH